MSGHSAALSGRLAAVSPAVPGEGRRPDASRWSGGRAPGGVRRRSWRVSNCFTGVPVHADERLSSLRSGQGRLTPELWWLLRPRADQGLRYSLELSIVSTESRRGVVLPAGRIKQAGWFTSVQRGGPVDRSGNPLPGILIRHLRLENGFDGFRTGLRIRSGNSTSGSRNA